MTKTMTTTHSSYENSNPFLLPEMLHLLYPLLSTEDLLKVITICKYWNSFFIPRIWQTLNVGANHRGRAHIHTLDHLDGLEKHIHFVRHLDIAIKGSSTIRRVSGSEAEQAEERLKVILVQCRGLTQLSTDSVYEELFEVLANNRGSIASFKLNSAADDQDMLRLWRVLGDDTNAHCMGNLRHLALKRVEIPGDGGDPAPHLAFVKLCRRLETLDCYSCSMRNWTAPVLPIHNEGENEEGTQQMPWAIKQVKFTNVLHMISVDVLFLKRCICLERLIWSTLLDQRPHRDFLQFLIESRLKSLSVNGLSLPDESLARLIEHLPSTITELRFNTRGRSVDMGPRSVAAAAAVTSPSLSLVSIAPGPSKLTSAVTQQLLSSCGNIVRLDDTLSVDAVDLLTAPWVMSRLVKLELTINGVAGLRTASSSHTGSGSSQNVGFDDIIYEQLSRLVSLEDLALIETPSAGISGTKNSWIKFSLSHGMGELETLVHLRRLDIGRLQGLKMGADEGRWICKHWPALENLVVLPQKDFISYEHLISYLQRNRPGLKIDGEHEETL
ncbi:hypothetical protein B0O80DRAFT_503318 [Mortierella sp. GBAus27b]|nr:hypothetical protein B0O80DRAFT_503318 [Mortierella sp. GBAus27b]